MLIPFQITENEVKCLAGSKVPLSLLPKLSEAVETQNPLVIGFLEEQGINLEFFKLLPLLLTIDLDAKAPPATSKAAPKPAKKDSPSSSASLPANPEELASALGGVLEGAGFKKDEEKKPTAPQKLEGDKKGWLRWWGTYAIGGLVVWKTMD